MKKIIMFVFILVAVFTLGGCKQAEKTKIGLSISDLSVQFFVSLRDGALAEVAKNENVELIVLDAQGDAAKQADQIDDLIVKKVSVIIVNPVNSDSIGTAIGAANDADIPVITVDRGANAGEVVTHIASDNVAGGRMAGEHMLSLLGNDAETAKVLELEGIPGTSAATDRGTGFNEAVTGNVGEVVRAVANFDRAEGLSTMEDMLTSNPDIKAVFAHNDDMALGAIEAIKTAGKLDQIIVIGFDATDDAKASIDAGELSATIEQQPKLMGELSIQNAMKIINGESVDANIPVELALVKKD